MNHRRLLQTLMLFVCVLVPFTAGAANYDYKILIDADNSASTGCSAFTMSGLEWVVTTSVVTDDSGARVTGVTRQNCESGSLGVAVPLETEGWAASWNPTSGLLDVETRLRFSDLGVSTMPIGMRLGFLVISGSATDLVVLDDNEPIIFPANPSRRRAIGGPLPVNVNGDLSEWRGFSPLVEGISPNGAPVLRFLNIYAGGDANQFYFAFQSQSHRNAPTAVDDLYTIPSSQPSLLVNAPGVLGNDVDPRSLPLSAILQRDVKHGTLTLNANGSFSYTPNGSPQPDDFRYKASNGEQESNTARVDLVPEGVQQNHPPVAVPDQYGLVGHGGMITINAPGVLGNDQDQDGNTLTAVLVDDVDHGTLTFSANGGFQYKHDGSNTLSDSFTYRAFDGIAFSNTVTVQLTIGPNAPPVANADSFTVNEGGTVSGNVLTNDTDPDTPHSSLRAQLVTGPANASSFVLNNNGTFTYTHNGSETTSDSFTYRAQDGILSSAVTTVTITITPVNDPPVVQGETYNTLEDQPLTVPAPGVLSNDSDPDNPTLTAALVTNGTKGNVVLAANGGFTYTPNAHENGTDTFTYSVTDGNTTLNATATINITPVNDAPSFTAGPNIVVDSNAGAQNIDPWATAISRGPSNESGQSVNFEIVSNDNAGLFSVQPSVSPTGALTFTPVPGSTGVANISVRIKDDGGTANGGVDASAAQNFSINVDSVPFVASTTPAASGVVATNSTVAVNFSEAVNLAGTWFQIVCSSSGTHNPGNSNVSGGPQNYVIDPNADFVQGETCSMTVFAAQVSDADPIDPPNNMAADFTLNFSVDAQPSVVSSTPANGATGVISNSNLSVTFSEPVNVNGSTFTLNCTMSGALSLGVSGGPTTFTLDPAADLAPGETCTLTVTAANVGDQDPVDPPDTMAADYVATFTVDAAPSVTATTPANGAADSQPNTDVTITFSEPVNVTGSWFQIVCTTSGTRDTSNSVVTGGPTTFTINPNVDFTPGETCNATVFAANVDDQDANDPPANMLANYNFTFLFDQAPSVTATTPANAATDLATTTNIDVTFSEPVTPAGSWFTINCTTSGAHTAAVSGGPAAYTLDPTSDFAPNETCTVTILGAQVSDNDANDPPDTMAADYVFSFSTDAAPSVTTTTPANGATDQSASTDITVNFSESVNVTGTFATINCTVSGAHTYTTSGSGASRTINPDTDFTQGETCTVTILATEVADADANDPPDTMLANHVLSFSIDAAPSVVTTTPANGATQIGISDNINLAFSEDVTLTNASVTVSCASTGAHTFALAVGPANMWTVNSDVDFGQGEVCTVTVIANQVSDNDSNDPPDNMLANYVFSFTTDVEPTVTATTPTNGGGSSPNANIDLTFSEPVNVTGSWFTISCTTSGAHTASVSGGPTTFTLDPSTDFTGGETCTVTIIAAQVADQDAGDPPNNLPGDYVFSFIVDAAPTVTSTTPTNGATDIAGNADVVVNFSESVVANGSSFTINCATSGAHAFAVSASPSASYTLNPTVDFAPNELCTVTVVAANVTDNDAIDPPDNMAADYVFSFTTDAAPSVTTTTPANGATDQSGSTDITVNFSESVNVTGTFATISCTTSGAHTYTTSGSGASRTINPDTDSTQGETCTVTILATEVADADANDPPDQMTGNYVFSFTIDQAPTVTATTPTNGATGIATNTNLSLTFSEAVTITNASVTISCGTSGAHTVAVSGGPTTWTVNPDTDFANFETCTVTVLAAGVSDNDGNDPPDNMAANYVFSFTTDQAPSVTATTPTNGGGTSPNGNISITFSEPVDATGSSFTISCTVSGAHTYVLGGTPTTYTLDPNTDFTGGETCTVTVIAAQVDDQDLGDPPSNMVADYVFSFTVDKAPEVVSTSPTNGSTNSATNVNIVITYDEPVTASGTAYTLTCTPSATPRPFVLSGNGTAVHTLDPNINLSAGQTCTVSILATQITDVDAIDPPDNMAANYSFSFTTDANPQIITLSPNDSSIVATNTNSNITWTEPVTMTSVTISCTVSGSHTSVLSTSDNITWTVNPDTDFTPGETCTITVFSATVTDNDTNDPPDNPGPDISWQYIVDTAPTVTNTVPANGSTTASTNTNLTIDFSESVSVGSVTISCASSGAHTSVVTGSPGTSITVNPDTDFAPGELCTVTVPAAQVSDSDTADPPNNMAADYIFSFTTDQPPTVTATTPTNGGIGGPSSDVTVTFSEAVDVTGSWFTISCSSTGSHTAVVTGGPTTFTLNPDTDFAGGETCNVSILAANVTDQDANDPPDNMLANYNFSFTVDAAPTVLSTSPTNGSTNSASNVNIVITYDEPVTAGGTAYTIKCTPSNTARPFVLTGNGTAVHTLDPNTNLPAGQTCTVDILASQITDVDANDPPDNMVANYSFSFTTDANPQIISTSPVDGSTVAANLTFSMTWTETVTMTAVGISCTVSGNHTNVLSTSDNITWTVNPDTDFTPGETCTVTVLSANVTDNDTNDPPDNPGPDISWQYIVDAQPSVTATTPTNGAVNQATNTNIVITFSEAVNAPDAAFTINCGGAQAFTGSGSGTNTVTLDPTADLPAGTSCTVTVLAASVSDVDSIDPPDNMAANYVFSFTTDAAPSVTTTTPTNGATDIAKTSNITINFSENVDVTASSFQIKCPASGSAIGFAFVGGTTGVNTVTLDPSTDLVSGELCQVTVFANQVADSDANDPPNNMVADYVFSFGVEPDAINDTHPHTHVGNVPSNSATFFKVTTNDLSANPFTITAFDGTTVNGGTIVMQTSGANMGEFTYNPPPGFEGTDTFTYTISNVHGSDTATVSINVTGMIWFIDQNDGVGPFDGRLGSPFQTLAQFEAVNGNADIGNARNPQANDNIFLYQSGTAYTGPVTLENGQKVIGQDSATAAFGAGSITGLTAAPSQSPLPGVNSGDGVFVNITSAGIGFTAAQNNQIRGLRFGNNTGGAIVSANIGAAPGLIVRDALINNGTGGGVDVATGTIDALFASYTTSAGARGARLNAVGGTLSMGSGTISGYTNTGIDITGQSPTVSFSGTVSSTSGRTALMTSNMTGGSITLGTVNVSGAQNNNDAIILDGSAAIPAIDLTITSVNLTNTGNASDGVTLGDLGSGSDVTITGGSITTGAAGRRLINFTGATNCNCDFSGVTFNGSSSDGLSLGATQLGTYKFGNTTMNTPNGGIGIQVVGDANAANTDSTVEFKRVDIATCSATGILVHSHSGSFTVLGNAGANSGGTISGCTQRGAKFGNSTSANTGAKNISLTEMNFTGNGTANLDAAGTCGDGFNGLNTNCAANIDLQQVNTVTFTNLDVSGSAQIGINGRQVADLVMTNVQVNGNGNEALEDGIQLHNLTTTAQRTWSGMNVHDNTGRQIEVQNASGSNDVVIPSPTITNAAFPSATTGAQGILWSAHTTGNVKVSITNGTFTKNYGAAVFTDVADSASADVNVDGGTMTDNGLHFQAGMGGTSATGSLTYALKNLTSATIDPTHTNTGPIGILKGLNTTGNMTGTITGNTFGNPGVAFSGSPCISCVIIDVTNGSSDGGLHKVTISNNTFNQSGHQPINVTGGGNGTDTDASQLQVNITSNTIQNPSDPISGTNPLGDQAILVNIGTGAGDTTQACAHIALNTITGSWAGAAGGGNIRVRNRQPGTALRLPGFTGPFNDVTAAANFVSSQNSSVPATAQLQNGAVFTGGNPVPCF